MEEHIVEDVDQLIMIISLTPYDKDVFFIKQGTGKVRSKTFSSSEIQNRVKERFYIRKENYKSNKTTATRKTVIVNNFDFCSILSKDNRYVFLGIIHLLSKNQYDI